MSVDPQGALFLRHLLLVACLEHRLVSDILCIIYCVMIYYTCLLLVLKTGFFFAAVVQFFAACFVLDDAAARINFIFPQLSCDCHMKLRWLRV